ncbi:N-lysine methyltransferase KMT5A-A-like isoform X2 [Corticium candelabrum]|uniref:N-lysine methyltransferase KMT5A-A-like isoform X2 n=1 Tax=Corticium candelabrum TaxID=121492 RepID=UPI002E255650|nr:N-lysine methyltransferase KMT5A-A-like isoform X2 [Corticium candelabrum]
MSNNSANDVSHKSKLVLQVDKAVKCPDCTSRTSNVTTTKHASKRSVPKKLHVSAKKTKKRIPPKSPEADSSSKLRQTILSEHFRVTRSKSRAATAKEQQIEAIKDRLKRKCEDGLMVKDTEGKGRGVFASRKFKRGDLICEYSGELLSKREADKREKEYEGRPECGCYMYYFKFKGKSLCVDATKDNGRMGRLLNHSKTRSNVIAKRGVSLRLRREMRQSVAIISLAHEVAYFTNITI